MTPWPQNPLYPLMKPLDSYRNRAAFCLPSPGAASLAHTPSAPALSAQSGSSGCLNLLQPSQHDDPQNPKNALRSDQAASTLERGTMSYQRGSLRKVHHKAGDSWMLRYRMTRADGKRLECRELVGLVSDFPTEKAARREIERRGLLVRINEQALDTRIRFEALAEHYLKADFGENAIRPKSDNTIAVTDHIVRNYLVPRWRNQIADDIKSLDIQRWLKSLHDDTKLAWTTISKMRGIMSRIYKVGILHDESRKESRAACRDTLANQLQGHRPDSRSDVRHSQVLDQSPSFHAGAHLCSDGSSGIGDSGTALGGHYLA